jgi:hypothetical protein
MLPALSAVLYMLPALSAVLYMLPALSSIDLNIYRFFLQSKQHTTFNAHTTVLNSLHIVLP